MKNIPKFFLLCVCVLFFVTTLGYAQSSSNLLKADEGLRIQPTSIDGLTYLLFIWTGKSVIPAYYPQFEFEAGNKLTVTGVSSETGTLTGTWTEVDLTLFTYFSAQVEEEVLTSTTTITIPTTLTGSQTMNPVPPTVRTSFQINLWGISYELEIPPPFSISFSTLLGAGAYLGKDVIFLGFTGITPEEKCSSIDPTSGAQGQTNIQIDLVGLNTNFVEDETVVTFSGTGIDVSGVTVLDTEHISFNIDIDEFATTGKRDVIVSYPTSKTVVCVGAFTVLGTTNTSTSTTTAP